MRQLKSLCLAACVGLALLVGRSIASEGFDDIAKLAKSGVTEDVLIAYVQASPVAYDLTIDEILFLTDLGVSSKPIQEIVNHGKDLRAGKAPVVADAPVDNTPVPVSLPEENAPVAVNLANFQDPNSQPVVTDPNTPVVVDPNSPDANTGYISPLTGQITDTPEVVHETEIVRETVYTPTPVTACTECTISHFYEALTPYGTWVNLDGTWCWQPAVGSSDSSWRPYGNRGHWVWTDSGWCWESDYSWGWAPFHYGRWWRAPGYGWMWTPDTVWGPAWVNWRQGESHWGWAPLPPAVRFEQREGAEVGFHFGGKHWGVNVGLDFGLTERDYCFVPQDHFCDRNLHSVFVSRDDRTVIYSQTTIIQNNIIVQNNTVFVNGPSYRAVEQRTGRPLVQVHIGDSDVAVGVQIRGSVNDRENHTLRFYRPHVSAVAAETPAQVSVRQIANTGAPRVSADPRVLAAQARADELRERHFATEDARRQEALTRQSAVIEEVAARRSDNEQRRLNTLMASANTQEDKAAFAAKLAAERQRAEDARLQKVALEKQAADQRRLTLQLAAEQNRVAHSVATTESVQQAAAARAELAAQRAAREQANKEAALAAAKVLEEQRARNAALQAQAKNNAQAKALAAAADRQARLDAERAARERNAQAQQALMAKQKAQLDAERAARSNAIVTKPKTAPAVNNFVAPQGQPVQPAVGESKAAQPAPEKAAREAALEANRQRAEANREAMQKAAADKAAQHAQTLAAEQAAAKAAAEANREKLEVNKEAAQKAAAERAAELAKEQAAAKAAREATLEANRQKAEEARAAAAAKAAALKAEREAAKAAAATPSGAKTAINPKTGKAYDPTDLTDPNNPHYKKP